MRPFAPTMAAAVLVLTACTDGGETRATDDAARPSVTVQEGEYVVTDVEQAGRPRPLVEGSTMRVRFQDQTMTVHAGCNHLSSDYELEGSTLRLGPMAGTEMGCPEPLMEQDAWLADVLRRPVTVGEDPLSLAAGDVVFVLRRAPGRPGHGGAAGDEATTSSSGPASP